MNIPFLHFFKRKSAEPAVPAQPAVEIPPPVEKTGAERLRKTVTPSASRATVSQESFQSTPSPAPAPIPPAAPTVPFSLGGASAATATAPAAHRAVSFAKPAATVPAPLRMPTSRPVVGAAPATPERGERMISIELGDIVPQLPADLVNASDVDPTRRISLPAAEIERGMSNGRPSVSLASLYEQAPDIFVTAPSHGADVSLPFSKVLDQFAAFQVRRDQHQDEVVPQVETPFLKVTLEDSEKFGTAAPQLQTCDIPPVRVEPATAKTLAAAEPEAAAQESTIGAVAPGPEPLRISPSGASKPKGAPVGASPATPANISSPPAPVRIPFKLSVNGTDAPATESVPASTGPSVPNNLPAPPAVPFDTTAASETEQPRMPEAEPKKRKRARSRKADTDDAAKSISLSLRAVLQNLPAFQLAGDPEDVPGDVRFELPFSLIEPQLALGRIAVSPKEFEEALPEDYADIFDPNEANTPVALPLQEVLQNLPGALLRIRDDQEEIETGQVFDTPFSRTAEEDAKRLKVAATPIAKQTATAAEATEEEIAPVASEFEQSERTPLQKILDTDDADLDAKAVAAHIARMPGVNGCAVMFADGLSLAGNLPEEFGADGLCAMAPSLVQRVENHVRETNLGALNVVTLVCEKSPISFFMHQNICLAALHTDPVIPADVRSRLSQTLCELSRMYSQPA